MNEKLNLDKIPPFLRWNRLRAMREARGLSLNELAVYAGVSASLVWMLEKGYSQASQPVKKRLAKFLQVKIDDLFPLEMIGEITLEQFRAEAIARAKEKA
jgi:transcriptional regulator with XRE-family HTH domain